MILKDKPRPDFWIDGRAGKPNAINVTLVRAAEELWPRVFQIVTYALKDAASAAELLEQVVHEIAESQLEGKLPEELEAPQALLLARLQQRLINHLHRERRISYRGSLFELEESYRSGSSPNQDERQVHESILRVQALALIDENARRLLTLRLMGFRWSEIGRLMGERTGTVRERFRMALNRLKERLSNGRPFSPREGGNS
jgi:RNA polymerase sigma factor (sigma-70 family)